MLFDLTLFLLDKQCLVKVFKQSIGNYRKSTFLFQTKKTFSIFINITDENVENSGKQFSNSANSMVKIVSVDILPLTGLVKNI